MAPLRMKDLSNPPPASLLRERSFALFWLSRTATTLAIQMQAVAVGWQIYDITSSGNRQASGGYFVRLHMASAVPFVVLTGLAYFSSSAVSVMINRL